MPSIHFFSEDIPYILKNKRAVREWIKAAVLAENQRLKELTIVFCSDEYLLKINNSYLNHNTFTDIITFDNGDNDGLLAGDIFISIERVCENAHRFNVSETDELHRVMIHGVLHLLGYKDKSKTDKSMMTVKEDEYLRKRDFI